MILFNFGAMPIVLDWCLYGVVAIVLYVLFKDRLGSVQELFGKIIRSTPKLNDIISVDDNKPADEIYNDSELFFKLIKSWKETKDLAEQYGADKAVDIADQMFPHLIPKEENNVKRENPISYS